VGPGPLEAEMLPSGAHWVVNAAAAGTLDSAEAVVVEQTIPVSTLAHWDFGVDTVSHGSGHIYYAATLTGECSGPQPIVVAGVAVTWSGGK
jgi:hypothetical protein